MSSKSPNTEPIPTIDKAAKAEGTTSGAKTETGPLRLSDIKDLPPDQKNEAAQKAIREFNAAFDGIDPSTVRAALKKADNEITLNDLKAIDELEAKVLPFLNPQQTEKTSVSTIVSNTEETANSTEAEVDESLEQAGSAQNSSENVEAEPARQARLKAFVLEHFPDCPSRSVSRAAVLCQKVEDDFRELFEEPDLKLSADDAEDPDINAAIQESMVLTDTRTENLESIETKETNVEQKETTKADQETEIQQNQPKAEAAKEKLPELEEKLRNNEKDIEAYKDTDALKTNEKKRALSKKAEAKTREINSQQNKATAKSREARSEKRNETAEAKNEAVTKDLKTVKELQSRFNSLKAEKGTIGALKTLLGPDGVQSASMKAVVKRVLGTAQSLVAALPGKSAVVEHYLNQSSVDFSASALAQTFAGFLALVDNSSEFTEEERVQIRQILNSSSPAPAGSAAELKDALKNGRGTKQITEIQRVEEPPGSGNFIEKEVVVGTETIPFTKSEPYVLSNNPLVKLHPVTEGGTKYQVNAIVTNASPINFTVDIPQDKPIPEQAINNQVNQHLLRATLQNANLRGVMDFWYGQGDSTFGAGGETSGASLGGNDMSKAITNMFLGQNTLQGNRFLIASELGRIAHDARWLVPGGDFGGTNKVAGAESNLMMKALFGEDKTEITDNMTRAHFVINSGGAEAPSFECLYKAMYPEDTDFARLTDIVGPQAVAALNLDRPDDLPKAA